MHESSKSILACILQVKWINSKLCDMDFDDSCIWFNKFCTVGDLNILYSFTYKNFQIKIDHVVALWRICSVFQDVLSSATTWRNFKFFNLRVIVWNFFDHMKIFYWSLYINWAAIWWPRIRNFRINSYILWKYFA